ncbi:hypothetical protein FNF27_07237 [Cafeteria roenbergensis]|uniref:Amino acid permease/ SLC12A domain-containing protein n=1 Tax=Cafeteria roenbergensis TaxID=33653 RepID=A0A5A8DVT7_CAFRO|nr:hypothetical protein FNF27_07237 [Cafeteria roenbergensis]
MAAAQASIASGTGSYSATWGARPELETYGGDGRGDGIPGIAALRRGRLHANLADVFATDMVDSAARTRDEQAKADLQQDGGGASGGGDSTAVAAKPAAKKFGMLDGVLARCLVQIWGVIIFLRLGWLVGYGGIGVVIGVVLLSSAITTLTTLSLSAISTNGRVQGGGAYFLISRSLGPELGGAIGVLFAAANAVAIALYLLGLAETVVDQVGVPIIDRAWDLRIIAFICLAVLTVLVFVGISVVIKFQLALLLLLLLAFASFIAGVFLDPDRPGADAAAVALGTRNWQPAFDGQAAEFPEAAAKLLAVDGTVTFATCLAIFFPAATGIMAGANISGDLKSPRTAIPNGTLLSIGISALVYVVLVILIGSSAERTVDLGNGNFGGLLHDNGLMAKLAAEPWLVNLGIYAATLSSALASLVGAPRILQAVAKDNLFPFLRRFGNGYGGNDEPLEAYALSVLVAAACIAIGELNLVAPLVTSLFLLSYFLVNYACLAAELSRSPGWRPSFRYYSKYSSALGAAACLGMLLFLDYLSGIVAVLITGLLFLYVKHTTAANVSWGSASEGSAYMAAVRTLSALQRTQRHVKNWRPQFLVLVGGTLDARLRRAGLVHFMRHMGKGKGVTVYARVLSDSFTAFCARKAELYPSGAYAANEVPRRELLRWLHRLRAAGFAQAVVSPSLRTGVQSLLQLGGLGQLRPNIAVLGAKTSWRTEGEAAAAEYVGMIGDAFDMDCGVAMVCGLRRYEDLTAETDPVARHAKAAAAKVRQRLEEAGIDLELVSPVHASRHPDSRARAAPRRGETSDDEDDDSDDGSPGRRDDDADAAHHEGEDGAVAPDGVSLKIRASAAGAGDEAGAGESLSDDAHGAGSRGGSGPGASHRATDSEPGRKLLDASPDGRLLPAHQSMPVPDLMRLFEHDMDEGGNAAVEAGGSPGEDSGRAGCCAGLSRLCGTRMQPGHGAGSRIDVWWLSDDGGLTIMLPHLLSRCRRWRGASIRVWVVSKDGMQAVRQQRSMAELLAEVRIPAEVLAVHNDTPLKPSQRLIDAHAALGVERVHGEVSDQSKAFLRMGEIIEDKSADAAMVFVSLPVPRQGQPARRYLSWVDSLSSLSRATPERAAIPVVMVRGNNSPVLTFFS